MKPRLFTMADQLAFAALSGDYNPMHVDVVAARRLIYGRPVVHGIHLLLWALDDWLREATGPVALREVTLVLKGPVGIDEPVTSEAARTIDDSVELVLRADDAECALVRFTWAGVRDHAQTGIADAFPASADPHPTIIDEIRTAAGSLDLVLPDEPGRGLLPHVITRLPASQTAVLLATTRLVGMRCPGLDSIYAALRLVFADDADHAPRLSYAVRSYHDRLALLTMDVWGAGARGTVKAYRRPQSRQQARYADLRHLVTRDEFHRQRALVIGGSRGLGEVTAKLLAAGGADVRITFCQGADDAARVVSDICSGGGHAASLAWDVVTPPADMADDWRPSHLYYFATPHIGASRRGAFSARRFMRFIDYYVTGFLASIRAAGLDGDLKAILFPSSVFVDEPSAGMTEYAAAKAAGEVACRVLAERHPAVRIHAPRMPRAETDQTASLLPTEAMEPAALMLEHLRRLA